MSVPGMTSAELASTLIALGAATLGECGGVPMTPRIRAVWGGARLASPVYTVACAPGDNLAIHVAVAQAPPGHALAVAASVLPERGYWGEVLTTAAQARGVAGLVIDGGVRDVSALYARRFPVFSTVVALPGATKVGPGEVGAPVTVGDVSVRTGDWVVADSDGVTVIPVDRLEDVVRAGQARAAREAEFFRELETGRTTIEFFGLDAGRVTGARSSWSTGFWIL